MCNVNYGSSSVFYSQMAGILSPGVTCSEWEHLSGGVWEGRTTSGSKAEPVEDQQQRSEEGLGGTSIT